MTTASAAKRPVPEEVSGAQLVELNYSGRKGSFDVRVYISDNGRADDKSGRSTDGLLDAIAKAINLMIPHKLRLVGYNITTTGTGTEAVAQAAIVLQDQKGTYLGDGEDSDTATAAARAYLEALNEYRRRNKS